MVGCDLGALAGNKRRRGHRVKASFVETIAALFGLLVFIASLFARKRGHH